MPAHFLGVDQSLRSPGFAVVNIRGEIIYVYNLKTGPLRGGDRLANIFSHLENIIDRYSPLQAAIEGYSLKSVNRPFDLGEVGGVVRLALTRCAVPYVVASPTQLKKFVTGNGGAQKKDVQKWLYEKWKISLQQDDQADAAGLAQLARLFLSKTSTYRHELEVIKALSDDKKTSLFTKSKTSHEI